MDEQTSARRARVPGIALGVMAALLIWPASRWLVLAQIDLGFPLRAAGATAGWHMLQDNSTADAASMQRTAALHSDDYQCQLAAAVMKTNDRDPEGADDRLARVRVLEQRFPELPGVYANALRIASLRTVRMMRGREQQIVLAGRPAHSNFKDDNSESNVDTDSVKLAAYDHDAAEGERLDPDNAYFPAMRAVELLTAGRDSEGLAALERASRRSGWEEYYSDEVAGERRLYDETFSYRGAEPGLCFSAGLLFPQYAQIRAASRAAIGMAVEAELAGQPEKGYAIRTAVRRIGSIMRSECRSLIGNVVGMALVTQSYARPGGAPLPAPVPEAQGAESAKQRLLQGPEAARQPLLAFETYLRATGHGSDVPRLEQEQQDDAFVKEVGATAMSDSANAWFGLPMIRLGQYWIVDMLLVLSIYWTLAAGIAALLVSRLRGVHADSPLHRSTSIGILTALGTAGCLAIVATCRQGDPGVADWIGILGVTVASAMFLARRAGAPGRVILGYTAALLCLAACTWLCKLQYERAVEPFMKIVGQVTYREWVSNPVSRGALMLAPLMPLALTTLVLGVLSKIWRIPLSVGIARGMRGCVVPIAAVLILLYCGAAVGTLKWDRIQNQALSAALRGEARYTAAQMGRPWPGPVD